MTARRATCNANTKRGAKCRKAAGWGTPNDTGPCRLHGGNTPSTLARQEYIKANATTMGVYSSHMERTDIIELAERFRTKVNPTDLHDELALIRAVVLKEIDRVEDLRDHFMRWGASFTRAYQEKVSTWFHVALMHKQSLEEAQLDEDWEGYEKALQNLRRHMRNVPDPLHYMDKPTQLHDLGHMTKLLNQVGTLAEKIHKIEQDGSVSIATLLGLLNRIGEIAINAARDTIRSDVDRAAFIAQFRESVVRIPLVATGSPVGDGSGVSG